MAPERQQWKLHWKHLHDEVVTPNMCTGCAGCIVVCPHDVLGYDDHWHPHLRDEGRVDGAPDRCVHGEKACTMCTRACPRLRSWEPEIDAHLFERTRDPASWQEVVGVHRDVVLARTTNAEWLARCQDGGLASATLLWCLRQGEIDAALVSYVDDQWRTRPGVATTEEDVLAAAGSRYTYSANTLAYFDAVEAGHERLALVGMGCQSSTPPMMAARGARKPARRFVLNIGLLCSKTFTDDIFEGLLEAKYGLARTDIVKMNIKGKLQLWLRDDGPSGPERDDGPSGPEREGGGFAEVPLKECHEYTRPGCDTCPDFAAEHADISLGGLGQSGWTLTIVRTGTGRRILDAMVAEGWVETQDAVDADPAAVELMRKLAVRSRKRWPVAAGDARPGEFPAPAAAP